MATSETLPADVRSALERLQDATRAMPALEEEIDHLEHRLERRDLSAAHLGIRRSAEALLRHACREEKLSVEKREGTLKTMEEKLRPKVHDRVDESFWAHLYAIQVFVNRNAHSQLADVYHAVGLHPADPFSEVRPCLDHLASMATEFIRVWPRPAQLLQAPAIPSSEDASDARTAPSSPSGVGSTMAMPTPREIGDMSAKQALDDAHARLWLEGATSMTRGGITRRLNAVHGRTKLRNVFPDAFGVPPSAKPDRPEKEERAEEAGLDYELIGSCTVSQARELELAGDIARLTGLTEQTVKRKLTDLNGRGVIRRWFDWYDARTIADLTARTALDYRMAPLLARHLGRRLDTVLAAMRGVPAQTKLRTIFEDLEG